MTTQSDSFLNRYLNIGCENSELAALIAAACSSTKSSLLADMAERALAAAEMEKALQEYLFAQPSPNCGGPIQIGESLETATEVPVGLYPADFNRMVLIVGTHGSGKTTLILHLLRQMLARFG